MGYFSDLDIRIRESGHPNYQKYIRPICCGEPMSIIGFGHNQFILICHNCQRETYGYAENNRIIPSKVLM